MSLLVGILIVSICLNVVLIYANRHWEHEFKENINNQNGQVHVHMQRQGNKLLAKFEIENEIENFDLSVYHDLSFKKHNKEVMDKSK